MNIETPEINNPIEKTNKPAEKWTKDMTIMDRENISKALVCDILKQDQSKLKFTEILFFHFQIANWRVFHCEAMEEEALSQENMEYITAALPFLLLAGKQAGIFIKLQMHILFQPSTELQKMHPTNTLGYVQMIIYKINSIAALIENAGNKLNI